MLRGEVYELRPVWTGGHEQQGRGCGVVVQSGRSAPRSAVVVAPTWRSARPASFRPEIEVDGGSTRVLVEQVVAVDTRRLGDLVGYLTREQL